jgi:ribosomal protein L37AE/L43A
MAEMCPLCEKHSNDIIAERMRDIDKKVFYCKDCDVAFKEGIYDAVHIDGKTKIENNNFMKQTNHEYKLMPEPIGLVISLFLKKGGINNDELSSSVQN